LARTSSNLNQAPLLASSFGLAALILAACSDPRWLKFGGQPHNRLLTSLLNVFGDPRTSIGDSRVASSALTGLF
jgi:hypothetical protein